MNKKLLILTLFILTVGVIYRLLITSNGYFIFNMDNARDMVDVREMVVLNKLRLIGPTSGIEGFFNGPGWYYLLFIPFILSNGHPYAAVLLMIILWVIGGFFLVKILSRFGVVAMLVGGGIWIFSDYVVLATKYSYNPNPVVLLTPLFIFLLERYIKTKALFYGCALWFLGGLFFNFEMAFGIFIPIIILFAFLFSGNFRFLLTKRSILSSLFFILTLFPQLYFEFRHNFFMTKSVINHLSNSNGATLYSVPTRMIEVGKLYQGVLSGVLMNWQFLTYGFLIILLISLWFFFKQKQFKKDYLLLIIILCLFVPLTGHILLPVNVMPWHLGGGVAAAILFLGVAVGQLVIKKGIFRILGMILTVIIFSYAVLNLELGKNLFNSKTSNDPAVFANEIAAVDYVYQSAQGRNFKVYTYLPSVIDYPYQYLFWWRGLQKYGFTPLDYAYLPDKPAYIGGKDRLGQGVSPENSGLIFLIKQPDQRGERHLWENSFANFPLLKSENIGPLIIETRKEIIDNN